MLKEGEGEYGEEEGTMILSQEKLKLHKHKLQLTFNEK